MKFEDFNLAPSILRALKELKYENASPIQNKTIPAVLSGRDLIGCAETGTGKTCAFAVPIINRLISIRKNMKKKVIRALVVAPTRELAMQIFDSFRSYTKYNRIRSCVVFGAVGYRPQIAALESGADVLIATPGRLNGLVRRGYVDLSNISFFVLDEADIMLDMGFIEDIKKLIKMIPQDRQTLMFSATMSRSILSLANSILKRPVKAIVSRPSTTIDSIDQSVYMIDKRNKMRFLIQLIDGFNIQSALVFTRTKTESDKVAKELLKNGIVANSIHSNKSQWDRLGVLKDFKQGDIRVLVATDIIARGIDIKGVSHVINYDIPHNSEAYVHRIGRTGRAGNVGVAITFCEYSERNFLRVIEKAIRKKIKIVNNYNQQKNCQVKNKFFINIKKNKDRDDFFKTKNTISFSEYIDPVKQFKVNEKRVVKNKAKSFDEWMKNENQIKINRNIFKNNSKQPIQSKNHKDKMFDFALRKPGIKK